MKPVQKQEEIDEMRRRLYDRGTEFSKPERHALTDQKVDVARDWGTNGQFTPSEKPQPDQPGPDIVVEENANSTKNLKPKRGYRKFVFIGSIIIFLLVAGFSTLLLIFGGNSISNENIQISVSGPSYIVGGDTLSMQLAIANQNSVPIESATLIVKYPPGTRSIEDEPRNLYEDRIPLNNIEVGEVKNIPISVTVFGEENDNKVISATVEYRVDGSNGMFYKDAEDFNFRINSSPVVLRIDNVEKVASGQLVDVTFSVVSNASAPLHDVLVSASYPNGFTFENSTPEPVFSDNVWRIEELLPEQSVPIKVQGIISGLTEETIGIDVKAGLADLDNQFAVAAVLANGRAEFNIERPFIDVRVMIDGVSNKVAIIDEGERSDVKIDIVNTLDETVYDMAVVVVPGGSALTESSIISSDGFYDSNSGTVRWETANDGSFDEVLPGDKRSLGFKIEPGPDRSTVSYDLVVNVYARRVAESSAQETLIGTTKAEAKYSSVVSIGGQASIVSGPVPPEVGEKGTYEISLVAEAGANDLSGTVVETSLPLYVNWIDQYNGDGELTYNSVSKQLRWEIGDISSGQRKQLNLKLEFTPSVSQKGDTPVLINSQKIRANDRFTGALLQDSSPAVTTELSQEMGYQKENGRVVD